MWTDDLYRAEQEASKARRERLASAMKRVRNLSMMGNIGVAILGACAVLLSPLPSTLSLPLVVRFALSTLAFFYGVQQFALSCVLRRGFGA